MAIAKKNDSIFNIIKEAVGEPSKEEYYKREDEMMTELKAIREETAIQSGQLSDHSDRIENLENIHPRGKHAVTI
jgi:hypothetical protein